LPSPPLTPLAAAVLRVPPPERALVIECGEGDAVLFLAREFLSARVRGTDRSEDAIRTATAKVGLDREGRVAFKAARPGALPFPDDHFDLVVAVDRRPSAAETARVLRGGGAVVIADSAPISSLAALHDRLFWRSLRRRGIERTEAAAAGDGSFAIGRVSGGSAAGDDE
jgi:ubiquinone/menaquinone biosynthesis C-methylase UbiE